MNEPMHFDLVAIGGGFAGICAAVRGAELGLRTAVLETGTDEGYLCSSRWAGGIFHVSYHDVKLTPGELLTAINRQTDGETDQELAAAIAADAGRTVNWLASQGAAFTEASPIGWHRFTLAPPRLPVAGQDWRGRGPDRLLGELRRRLQERQGRLLLGTRTASLRLARGRVVGVTAHRDGAVLDIDADAVVIADGGFPGNAELLRKYIGPRPDRVLMRHAGTAIGDGLRMAAEAGAALVGLDRLYGHLLSRDAMENKGLWPIRGSMPLRRRLLWWIGAATGSLTRGWAAFQSPMTSPGSTTRYAPRWSAMPRSGRPPARPRRFRLIRNCLPAAAHCTGPIRSRRWPRRQGCRRKT